MDTVRLTRTETAQAIWRIVRTVFKMAPGLMLIQLAGAVISSIIPLALTFFAALTTTALADAYAGVEGAGERAILYVSLTVVAGIFMSVWRTVEQYVSQTSRYKLESMMSDKMYEQFLRLDFWRYDEKESVDLYEKAKQFAQFFPYVFSTLGNILTAIFTIFAGILALGVVSWWMSFLVLIAVVPSLFLQFRLSKLQAKHWSENIESRRIVSRIEWGLMQPEKIAELRLFGLVRHLLDLRQRARDKDNLARFKFEKSYSIKQIGADAVGAVVEIVSLVWITVQIMNRAEPVGQFLYVQQMVSRSISGAGTLVSSLSNVDEDLANMYDYFRFMELEPTDSGGIKLDHLPETIAVKDVSFNYPGSERKVLDSVSMTITRGQKIAIVGENGAGKSTLVKILLGLYHATSGQIMLDGQDLVAVDKASWHKYLSVLSQESIKYNFASARDNIRFGNIGVKHYEDRLKDSIKLAEAEFLYKLKDGLDSYVDKWMEGDNKMKGQDLSGGEWQRLALARSFFRGAPILVLDEPTSAIDALAESRIFANLFNKSSDDTLIVISHRYTTIRKADVVYMLKDGKIVESGTPRALIQAKGEFYKMFESQL